MRDKFVIFFNKSGDYLTEKSIARESQQAQQQIQDFYGASAEAKVVNDILFKASPREVIACHIKNEFPDAINYVTLDGKSASINKDNLFAIIRQSGSHEMLRDLPEVADNLSVMRDDFEKLRFKKPQEQPSGPVPRATVASSVPEVRQTVLPGEKKRLSSDEQKVYKAKSVDKMHELAELLTKQQDLVLNNNSTQESRFVTRYFRLIDINTGKPVKGEVCLFFTQKDTRQCLQISNGTKQTESKMLFTQKDIVGIVATAHGYQTYHSNLIIDQLDRSTSVYQIALSKPVSIISFMVEAEGNGIPQLTDARGTKVTIAMADPAHGYAEVQPAQAYRLSMTIPGAAEKAIATQVPSTDGLVFASLKSVVLSPTKSPLRPAVATEALLPDLAITKPWTIFFDQSRYELRPAARQTLDSLASLLKNSSGYRIEITGHTDNVGDAQRNLALSEFRSRVTSRYLVGKGIAAHAVHWEAKGGNAPAYSNAHESTKALNRRVELKVIQE